MLQIYRADQFGDGEDSGGGAGAAAGVATGAGLVVATQEPSTWDNVGGYLKKIFVDPIASIFSATGQQQAATQASAQQQAALTAQQQAMLIANLRRQVMQKPFYKEPIFIAGAIGVGLLVVVLAVKASQSGRREERDEEAHA